MWWEEKAETRMLGLTFIQTEENVVKWLTPAPPAIKSCSHTYCCNALCVSAETLKLLQRLLKSPGCRKIPVLVQNKDDVIVTASNFSSER